MRPIPAIIWQAQRGKRQALTPTEIVSFTTGRHSSTVGTIPDGPTRTANVESHTSQSIPICSNRTTLHILDAGTSIEDVTSRT